MSNMFVEIHKSMGVAFLLLQLLFLIISLFINFFYPFKRHKWKYIAAYILYVPVTTYISQFWHHNISDEPSNWGVFGDYIGGVYNVLTSLLVAYISYKISKMQTRGEYTRSTAIDILNQIQTMKTKNYHHKSIDKLRRQAKENETYIGKLLKDNIIMLADNYVQVRYDHNPVNINLEKAVITELKEIAYG